MPQMVDDARTTHIPRPPSPPQYAPPSRPPVMARAPYGQPSRTTAVAAAAVSIISGWATSVVATDLIAGWWRSDRLFCVAVAFLALVFALATISGVILLLLRQPLSRYLIVAGAVVAILTYLGVFIAGARVAQDSREFADTAAAMRRVRGIIRPMPAASKVAPTI